MLSTVEISTPQSLETEIIKQKRAELESLWSTKTFQINESDSKTKEQLLSIVDELLIVETAVFKEIIDKADLNRRDKTFVLNRVADELTLRMNDFLADPEEIVEYGLIDVVLNRACQVVEESNCIQFGVENIEETFKREEELFLAYPLLCDRLILLDGYHGDEVMTVIKDLKVKTDHIELKEKCNELLAKRLVWERY